MRNGERADAPCRVSMDCVKSLRSYFFGVGVSLPAQYVSANYFRMFGVKPAAGRLLQPEDDRRDGELRRHQLVLRLRKEDGLWVQALKGVGDKLLERLEHEVGDEGVACLGIDAEGDRQAVLKTDLLDLDVVREQLELLRQ